jgi:hypothetical protein
MHINLFYDPSILLFVLLWSRSILDSFRPQTSFVLGFSTPWILRERRENYKKNIKERESFQVATNNFDFDVYRFIFKRKS